MENWGHEELGFDIIEEAEAVQKEFKAVLDSVGKTQEETKIALDSATKMREETKIALDSVDKILEMSKTSQQILTALEASIEKRMEAYQIHLDEGDDDHNITLAPSLEQPASLWNEAPNPLEIKSAASLPSDEPVKLESVWRYNIKPFESSASFEEKNLDTSGQDSFFIQAYIPSLPGAIVTGLAGVADEIAMSYGYTSKAYIAPTVLSTMSAYKAVTKLSSFLSGKIEQINKVAGDITQYKIDAAIANDKDYQFMADYHDGYGKLIEEVKGEEGLLKFAENLAKVAREDGDTAGLKEATTAIAYAEEQLSKRAPWIYENRFEESAKKMEAIKSGYVEQHDVSANVGLAAARLFGFDEQYADTFLKVYNVASK
ncbi:hypothetical protein RFI_35511, partial [Reticulomyxa filosa]